MLEGLPPSGAAYLATVRCDEHTARTIADIVVETFDPAETAAAAFEDGNEATTSWSPRSWLIEIYFGRRPDEHVVRDLIAGAIDEQTAAKIEFKAVETRDWVSASLAGLDAVHEGRFVVHGSHARSSVKIGDIGIEIEAALAFGTGHHGTTRGCLAMLNEVLRRRRPRHLLDVGTGTGVLAIAAARRLRLPVAAGDIDPIAVAAARDNAIRNAAGAFVRPVRAAGTRHRDLDSAVHYDLVFANILARPLCALAPHLRRLIAPGGEVILSGLLDEDVPAVLSAYRRQGFVLRRRRNIEGWATLLMWRPVSPV